jgi:hypothetical protein
MKRMAGLMPKANAGNATVAQIDLRLRGGTVMIRRRISPLSTRVSAYAMALRCQFGASWASGEVSGNTPGVDHRADWPLGGDPFAGGVDQGRRQSDEATLTIVA